MLVRRIGHQLALTKLALTLALGLTLPALAQTPRCPGDDLNQPHPHPYGPYNFETNSRREPITGSPQFKFWNYSCVYNPHPTKMLPVRWLIPGPRASVFPGKILEVRRRTTEAES